jgi:uncharacterized protein (TIGR03435 family)
MGGRRGGFDAIDDGASLTVALREQLGLRLNAGKGPHEFLVFDDIERPSEN